MEKKYEHLLPKERDLISVLKAEGHKARAIARALNRSPSTICRELKRNSPPIRKGRYLPHKAQARAEERRSQASQHERLRTPGLKEYVREKIKLGWSPEQIAGYLKIHHPEMAVSHEAIYQWLYAEAANLVPLLTRAHRKRKCRGHSRRHKASHIPQRISILERPKDIEKRQEAGHWEIDTIVSRQSLPALLVMVERKTRLTKLSLLNAKKSHQVKITINRRLSRVPDSFCKTLTYDNGSENVDHLETNRVLGTQSYFCEPFHSWEKGTVENTAGLIRRVFPKKTDFAAVKPHEIKNLEENLNSRPRKCLGFKTPLESFYQNVALQG